MRRDRTQIVAIINVTPDSFSGDGLADPEMIVARAANALANGADVLEIGAESTRPGAEPVTLDEERRRLLPALKALRREFPTCMVSIDTSKAELFREAAQLGADILNLVRPLEDAHLDAVRDTGAALIITQPGLANVEVAGSIDAVTASLAASAMRARDHGIAAEQIVLDPGIGFGKTPDQNIALLGALPRLCELGFATMLAASRKSTLGLLTGREAHERVHATSATTALAALAGIDFVRVHDVAAAFDVVRVCDAVVRGRGVA